MINSCNDTKGIIMAIRYNKLWKKLIDENMMKVDLRDQAGMRERKSLIQCGYIFILGDQNFAEK